MPKKMQSPMGELISDRPYEYILQRLRLVMANKTPVLQVIDVADEPDRVGPNEYPSIAITIRVLGLKLTNPATCQPLLPERWFRDYFERWPVQEAFLKAFALLIAKQISPKNPEVSLKAKFKTITKGRASKLLPRADLRLIYQQVIRQLKAIKKWLRAQKKGIRGFTEQDKELLSKAPDSWHWWLKLLRENDIRLSQIDSSTPADTALIILKTLYSSEEEAIRSRLFRPEK